MKSILNLSLRLLQLNRVNDMSAEKSSRKGLVILFVGVMVGVGLGVATCVTMMTHPSAATASSKAETRTVKAPLPSLYPPPAQTASLTQDYAAAPQQEQQPAQQAGPAYQQIVISPQQTVAPAGMAVSSQDGSILMPGVNAYQTQTTQVAGVPTYETLSTSGTPATPEAADVNHVNPNWTVGRNGLVQNPCVDPPSAHGRATGLY